MNCIADNLRNRDSSEDEHTTDNSVGEHLGSFFDLTGVALGGYILEAGIDNEEDDYRERENEEYVNDLSKEFSDGG